MIVKDHLGPITQPIHSTNQSEASPVAFSSRVKRRPWETGGAMVGLLGSPRLLFETERGLITTYIYIYYTIFYTHDIQYVHVLRVHAVFREDTST